MAPFERVRTRTRAFERLFELATADRTIKRLFVAGAGDLESPAALVEQVTPLLPHTEIATGRIWARSLGRHAGPGALGHLYGAQGVSVRPWTAIG